MRPDDLSTGPNRREDLMKSYFQIERESVEGDKRGETRPFLNTLTIKTRKVMKTQFETLSEIAINNGFYLKNNELRHETFICDGGRYDGESIEMYWNPSTGKVHHIDYLGANSSKANFSFERFWDAQPILKK